MAEKKNLHKYIFYYKIVGMAGPVTTVVFAEDTEKAIEKSKALRPGNTHMSFDVIEREPSND